MISIIVAASTNLVIGKNNDLPWHLPSDLKRFKELTSGSVVYMGRNTWESIPVKFRPLPNRDNVVITRDKDYLAEGAVVTSDLEGLKRIFNLSSILFGPDEQFIIGGAEIYKQLLPIADKVYMTEVLGDIEGDTYLEGFNPEEWELANISEVLEENGFRFIFKEYIKKVA
jgi:dihydrofolate reductase